MSSQTTDVQAPSLSLFASGITEVPAEFTAFLEAGGEIGSRTTPLTIADLKKAVKEQQKLSWLELMDLIDASGQATQEQLEAVDDAPVGPCKCRDPAPARVAVQMLNEVRPGRWCDRGEGAPLNFCSKVSDSRGPLTAALSHRPGLRELAGCCA